MNKASTEVVVTGIKPTGSPHLGNYLGMIRPALDLASRRQGYVFVADGHAMTTVEDPGELAGRTVQVAATLLALGLDPARTVLYRQSDVAPVFELAWLLACSTPKGLLNRAHAYKAAQDANRDADRPADEGVSAGLFTYPVLMAADIVAMDGTLVPVGRDQAQHLEITRDVVAAFNRSFGPTFHPPLAHIDPLVETVPGTDGRKMSKSYGNVIPIFAEPQDVARRVRSIVTDSRPPEEPKSPEACTVFSLYRQLADPAEAAAMADRYRTGGVGYGEAKDRLIAALETRFGPARRTYRALMEDPAPLHRILADGAARARERAAPVLARARRARGLLP
ncbi:MAG TPA: tryptophan--tRNA ligase [Acidimicrobiales bacterium]|nr:tryptophan--tRNA ligase [Acidimicrobiales bacterium]